MSVLEERKAEYNAAAERLDAAVKAVEALGANASQTSIAAARSVFDEAVKDAEAAKRSYDLIKDVSDARAANGGIIYTGDGWNPGYQGYNFRSLEPGKRESIRVGREPLTYERNSPAAFFSDVYEAKHEGNVEAAARLERHAREMVVEKRALNETAGTGGEFVPPLWMQDAWIKLARAGRPFANVVNRLPLPPNTNTINFPSVTAGTATATQSDGGAVQSTDPTTGSLLTPVKTIAGQVDLARQLLDRSVPGMDMVLFDDLARDYATKLDVQCLSGSGSGPNATGILNVASINSLTYTSGSPTQAGLYPYFGQVLSNIAKNRFLPPDVWVMHPLRWYWLVTGLDSQNRPFVTPSDHGVAVNTFAGYDGTYAENAVGHLLGLPVVLDASVPTNLGAGTNQDIIFATRTADIWLFEDESPRMKVYEEVLSGNLQIRVQVYGYFAFQGGRYPKATGTISGTGLVGPAGY